MNPTWFDRHWCYFGLAAAAILLILLFATNTLRQRPEVSRWRDPVWLSWLLVASYFVHQFEEYGFDATGRSYGFPRGLCEMLGYPSLAECPTPSEFFVFVNIPATWLGAVIAALLSRRNHAVGLGYLGLLVINAIAHIAPAVAGKVSYDSGMFTAIVLFLPISTWIIYTCFGRGRLRYQTLAAILLGGILLHVTLIGSILLLTHGSMTAVVADAIQVLNPLWLFVLPWVANRIWPSKGDDARGDPVADRTATTS
jgi:hypothetical protein